MINKRNIAKIFIFIIVFSCTFFINYNNDTFYENKIDDKVLLSYEVPQDNGLLKITEDGLTIVNTSEINGEILIDNKIDNSKIDDREDIVALTYYVRSPFNVLIEPDKSSLVLDSVFINEPIEVIEETEEWAKIRIPRTGLEGYTFEKSYSLEMMDYINNVPFLNQISLGYPTGCEAVSATMAARFEGYDVDVQTIVNNTPTDILGKRLETITNEIEKVVLNEETGEEETIVEIVEEEFWVGENPFEYFVGHPTKTKDEGSYGCYAYPIEVALKESGIPCTNISNSSVEVLYDYIKQGKPVIVWGRMNAWDIKEGVNWTYPDGSGEYLELVGEHCFVLIGFNDNDVYLNDPIAGAGVKQPKSKFEKNWHILFDQALIVDRKEDGSLF